MMTLLDKNNYDAFISYSSKDVKYVRVIQKAIENYVSPKGLIKGKTNLKIFRDKDDQETSDDHEVTLNKWIEKIPGFILIGSKNSLESKPVGKEVKKAISKDLPHIYLAWLDDKNPPSFHDEISLNYPNAIYSDFRMLKTTNCINWIIRDRKLFKIEVLRIVASLLTQKYGQEITLNQLIQREKQKICKQRLVSVLAILLFVFTFSIYLASTPVYSWHHSLLFDKDITNCKLEIINGKPKLLVTNKIEKRWEDKVSGESGYDNDVSIYQLDEEGEIEGKIIYSTCGIEEGICGKGPEYFGSFEKMNESKILEIIDRTSRIIENNTEKYELNTDIFSNPTIVVSPNNDGVIFISSVKDTYPYNPKLGGAYRSTNFGKTWDTLHIDFWDSFSDIVFNVTSLNSYSVKLSEITGTNLKFPFDNPDLIPSIWTTLDDGLTWKQIENNMQNLDMEELDLVWMTNGGKLFALIPRDKFSTQLIIYKKRSIRDRLLQKFDAF